MNLRCAVGMHEWSGCKCQKCSKTRDESHDFSKDCERCAACGKAQTGAHAWTGCQCQKCGKTRDADHDWAVDCERCARCGKTRDEGHDWTAASDRCAKCGKDRGAEYALVHALLARIMKSKDDGETARAATELKAMGEKSLQPLLWEAFHERGDPARKSIDEYTIRMAVWCGCELHPAEFREFYRTNYKPGISPDLDRMRKINMDDGLAGKTVIHRLISPLTKYNSDKRTFAEDCLHCGWTEVEDTRRWSENSDCRKIQEMGNSGQTSEALALIDRVWPELKDYYFVYMWKMLLLARLGRIAVAESVFADGLSNSREKYSLCSNWAKIAYRAGNLTEAVRWWIRSIVSESSMHAPQSEDAFLYLAYVAKFLGEHAAEQKLFSTVDRLTRMGRYNEEEQTRIRALTSIHGSAAIREALTLLCAKLSDTTEPTAPPAKATAQPPSPATAVNTTIAGVRLLIQSEVLSLAGGVALTPPASLVASVDEELARSGRTRPGELAAFVQQHGLGQPLLGGRLTDAQLRSSCVGFFPRNEWACCTRMTEMTTYNVVIAFHAAGGARHGG